jgi:hypothetical protein
MQRWTPALFRGARRKTSAKKVKRRARKKKARIRAFPPFAAPNWKPPKASRQPWPGSPILAVCLAWLSYRGSPLLQPCLSSAVPASLLAVLSSQSNAGRLVLTHPFWLSRSSCPVLAVLFWLSFSGINSSLLCLGYLILSVLCWQHYPGNPVLAVLSWRSCHYSLVLSVLFCLSLSALPVLAALFWLPSLGGHVLSVLSWQPCPGSPLLLILSSLFCSACPVLSVLFCLS